jgi:CHAD domain-containing protein
MSFLLRPDESVTRGFRRLARKELEKTRDELRRARPPHDTAIHEARKSVKEVRALLQLIEDDGGDGLGGSGARLRSVNRTLSELRDADVMIETLARLRTRHPQLLSEHTFARVLRGLADRKRAAIEKVGSGAWRAVDRKLRSVRRRARHWTPAHRGCSALTRGIRAVHRRGRKAMRRAETRQRALDFHAWRKEMKALWYALRVIEQSDPSVRQDVRALQRAETWLGDEHNLVLLCEQLSSDVSVCRSPLDIDRLRLVVDREQCGLREKAAARVRSVYNRRSGAYARAVARACKAWRGRARHSGDRRRRRADRMAQRSA